MTKRSAKEASDYSKRKETTINPAAGNRNTDGTPNNVGNNGNYWSSTPNNASNGYNLNFNSNNVNPRNNNNYANGFSVRCVPQEFITCLFFYIITMSEKLLEDLFIAYYDARRNKRNTINQLKFELQVEDNLLTLYNQIKDRTYKVGRSVAFIIEKPVKREVFAATFADRVVHHLYFNYVNEIFEKLFIDDCYSCRKGKGTAYGINRIDHHIRSCSANYTKECYVLKLDLSGYFMHINRQILYDKVVRTLHKYANRRNAAGVKYSDLLDYELLIYLSREIIFHDPVANCYIKGDRSEWNGLPADKSLFESEQGCGLPIGNLTSQLFSNIYLNDFDNYMKRELKIKHYGRYVDDFYIIHPSKKYLLWLVDNVRTYLKELLGIVLHPKKIYLQHIYRGVVFLGAVIKPHRLYIANRTIKNLKLTLASYRQSEDAKAIKLMQSFNSYMGLLKHYKTYNIRKSVVHGNRWLFDYGWMQADYAKLVLDSSFPSLC